MADENINKDVRLLKGTKVCVFVDEALPDILVVTFEFGVKYFKGVLLDSSKQNLPCGIESLNPALKPPKEDVLYSVSQRYSYTQPPSAAATTAARNPNNTAKYKNNKMTVRLRPRQVLCSKCKGICNENSENVSQKRKVEPTSKKNTDAGVTRLSATLEDTEKKKLGEGSLVPRLTRLTPEEEQQVMDGVYKHASPDDVTFKQPLITIPCTSLNKENRDVQRHLRKKRSVGSMEDLWEFEQQNPPNENPQPSPNPQNVMCPKTIKISYGPQGEGTILKIPATTINPESDDTREKAEKRRAIKKARREARYNRGTSSSPSRYTVGSASPRHGLLGNISPRYAYDTTTSVSKKRKHKVKHKKKRKEDRKYGKDEGFQEDSKEIESSKEHCLTHKLSINLKRLNDSSYLPCTSKNGNGDDDVSPSSSSSSSEEHCFENVPDFPQISAEFQNFETLKSFTTLDGGRMLVGDVVWGKIHGFPWWPGKVLTITKGNQSEDKPQAHVAWYGSSTSSLILCDQLSPYLEHFKLRYNKKKRGPYKEAIKQASLEARETVEIRLKQQQRHLAAQTSPSHQSMIVGPQIVAPPLASPREIDVLS